MKNFFLIISLLFATSIPLMAQEEDPGDNKSIRDKMNEYIQRRLDLTKEEATKFSPVFLEYFKEWRRTIRENRGDKLELQKQVVDLRIRYRVKFREILGEQRGNQVFGHQDAFIREIKTIMAERRLRNPGGNPPPRRNRQI